MKRKRPSSEVNTKVRGKQNRTWSFLFSSRRARFSIWRSEFEFMVLQRSTYIVATHIFWVGARHACFYKVRTATWAAVFITRGCNTPCTYCTGWRSKWCIKQIICIVGDIKSVVTLFFRASRFKYTVELKTYDWRVVRRGYHRLVVTIHNYVFTKMVKLREAQIRTFHRVMLMVCVRE